jgi:hypothetical protein
MIGNFARKKMNRRVLKMDAMAKTSAFEMICERVWRGRPIMPGGRK